MLAFVRAFNDIYLARKPQMSRQQVNLLPRKAPLGATLLIEALNSDQYVGFNKQQAIERHDIKWQIKKHKG